MEEESGLVVGGYLYSLKEDADLARQEQRKIDYLEHNMDYKNPENILIVYKKAMESRVFRTPAGWEYLKKLQAKLEDFPDLKEKIPPIQLFTTFTFHRNVEAKTPKTRIIPGKKDNFKNKFFVLLIINLFLAAAVGAMFLVALNSNFPNIINYENNLVNKYAHWEQQLTERESRIRELEKEWSMKE